MPEQRIEYALWLRILPFLLAVGLLLLFYWAYSTSENPVIFDSLSRRQVQGTLVLFALMPGYQLIIWFLQNRSTHQLLRTYEPMSLTKAAKSAAVAVEHRRTHLHPLALLVVLVGILFGASQNWFFIKMFWEMGGITPLDILFTLGNCMVWGTVFLILCWRIPVSYRLSQMGRELTLDLYRLDQLAPAGRMATIDILLVTGAMAFMALQSLDAEWRWGNYLPGIAIGVPSAILLFVLPLWGLRQNVKVTKTQRIAELHAQLDQTARDDFPSLELFSAHVSRIRDLPNWPVDLALATRILAYTIIPPLAWVGAALVENLVDRVTG